MVAGCGPVRWCGCERASIHSQQMIIRIVQSKGRKDRHVMLPAEVLELLRQWWKARPSASNNSVAPEHHWLFPGRRLVPNAKRGLFAVMDLGSEGGEWSDPAGWKHLIFASNEGI